jgi:hypothetical protein
MVLNLAVSSHLLYPSLASTPAFSHREDRSLPSPLFPSLIRPILLVAKSRTHQVSLIQCRPSSSIVNLHGVNLTRQSDSKSTISGRNRREIATDLSADFPLCATSASPLVTSSRYRAGRLAPFCPSPIEGWHRRRDSWSLSAFICGTISRWESNGGREAHGGER